MGIKSKFYVYGHYKNEDVIFLIKVGFNSFTVLPLKILKKQTEKQILKVGASKGHCDKLVYLYHDRFYTDRSLTDLKIIDYSQLLELLK